MAFQKEATRTPASIGRIEIILRDSPTDSPTQSISYQVNVIFSDESVQQRSGDLEPHLTTAQKNQLTSFLATMRTKAVAEFL